MAIVPVITSSIDDSDTGTISVMDPAGVHVHCSETDWDGNERRRCKVVWDFGDPGSNRNVVKGFAAAHVYNKGNVANQEFTITLTITDEAGSVTSVTRTVQLTPDTRTLIHVDADATGAADGTSRADAYTSITAAFAGAGGNGTDNLRIRFYSTASSTASTANVQHSSGLGGWNSDNIVIEHDTEGTRGLIDLQAQLSSAFICGTRWLFKDVRLMTSGTPGKSGFVANIGGLDIDGITMVNCSMDTNVCARWMEVSGAPSLRAVHFEDCEYSGDVVGSDQTIAAFAPFRDIYDTGTVEIVNGVVTLTGGTWPDWAVDANLHIGVDSYSVATRDSDTQITLDDTGVNEAASTAYELIDPVFNDLVLPDTGSGMTWYDCAFTATTGRITRTQMRAFTILGGTLTGNSNAGLMLQRAEDCYFETTFDWTAATTGNQSPCIAVGHADGGDNTPARNVVCNRCTFEYDTANTDSQNNAAIECVAGGGLGLTVTNCVFIECKITNGVTLSTGIDLGFNTSSSTEPREFTSFSSAPADAVNIFGTMFVNSDQQLALNSSPFVRGNYWLNTGTPASAPEYDNVSYNVCPTPVSTAGSESDFRVGDTGGSGLNETAATFNGRSQATGNIRKDITLDANYRPSNTADTDIQVPYASVPAWMASNFDEDYYSNTRPSSGVWLIGAVDDYSITEDANAPCTEFSDINTAAATYYPIMQITVSEAGGAITLFQIVDALGTIRADVGQTGIGSNSFILSGDTAQGFAEWLLDNFDISAVTIFTGPEAALGTAYDGGDFLELIYDTPAGGGSATVEPGETLYIASSEACSTASASTSRRHGLLLLLRT